MIFNRFLHPTCSCGCGIALRPHKSSSRKMKFDSYPRYLMGHNAKNSSHFLIQVVINKIDKVHQGVVSLVKNTYVNTVTKATFIDRDFGSWNAKPSNVLNGRGHPKRKTLKAKATNMLRYGVEFPVQNEHIYMKMMNSSHNVNKILHWKTQQILCCRASYEKAFVNWCNLHKIDFDWQIPIQTPALTNVGKSSTYFVDAFIKTGEFANTWIEIKGYWRDEQSKQKWEWFHSQYPNSQLWMKDKLIKIGILK